MKAKFHFTQTARIKHKPTLSNTTSINMKKNKYYRVCVVEKITPLVQQHNRKFFTIKSITTKKQKSKVNAVDIKWSNCSLHFEETLSLEALFHQ